MRPSIRSWLRRGEHFWDHLLGRGEHSARKPNTRLHCLALEDRVVPAIELALGAAPGERPEVHLHTGDGTHVRSILAYEDGFTGGVRTALADVNRDGVPDLVTAPGPGGGPLVKVFDGASGELVGGFFAFDPEFRGGVHVAAGEIGHGERGLVVGADAGEKPEVRVFSAAGELWRSILAYEPGFRGGVRVALGYGPTGNATVYTAPGEGGGPHVQAFEIRSGERVTSFFAYEESFRGGVWVSTGEFTGDGVSDIVTGAGPGGGPRVRTFSGQSQRVLDDFFAGEPDQDRGVVVGTRGSAAAGPKFLTSVAAGESTAVRAYERGQDPRDLLRGPAGRSLATPTTFADVLRFDGDAAVPRTLDRAVTGAAAPPLGVIGPELLAAGAGQSIAPSGFSDYPVRYADGVVHYVEEDLSSAGFGWNWGITRSWTNQQTYTQGQNVGRGWVIGENPSLLRYVNPDNGDELITVVTAGTSLRYFDKSGTGPYVGRSGIQDTLVYDSGNGQYVLTDPTGRQIWFWDFDPLRPGEQQGRFQKLAEPSGNIVEVVTETLDGRIEEVERTATVSSEIYRESYVFTFVSGGDNDGLIASITQRRKVGAGSWSTIRVAEYSYYDGSTDHGDVKDLASVVIKDGSSNVLETSYYRYYKENTSGGGDPGLPGGGGGTTTGYAGGLKLAFRPDSYARLATEVTNPQSASDATIAPYADHFFDYDDQFRVIEEVAQGAGGTADDGLGTFTYSYSPNEFMIPSSGGIADYNVWAMKTVETLPDGTTNTVYTNEAKQVMLRAYTESSNVWREYFRYDSAGRLILAASPSAVTGHTETVDDLVNVVSGNAQYLADSTGLFVVYEYGSSTTATTTTVGDALGRLKEVALRRGETGSDVPQEARSYIKRTVGSDDLFFEAGWTRYRNSNGTGDQAATIAYTWHGSTAQPASVTVTQPTVTTAQNGPNTATTSVVVFDSWGRPVWGKDAGSFLSYAEYDTLTGALVKTIHDVDSTQTSDFTNLPSGWSTPSGGGLHAITLATVDLLGRPTQVTAPNGRVDYRVYDDVDREVRTYPGWNSSTNLPTGPTEVVRADWERGYVESLTMSATPSVTGGVPTGTESIASLQSLSRTYSSAGGLVTHSDDYFHLSGLSYTTSTSLGTLNTHFYRVSAGYDERARLDRLVSAAGTITRTVYDGLGRAVSEWVGTDDTPTTGFWSPTNLTGTDMVKVREYQYDGGGIGDGNLTKITEIPGLSAADRVTQTWYDWRNRPVIVKSGVETSESTSVNRLLSYTEYDNLGQSIVSELYDGDAVTVSTTSGVPDRPSSSLLRAKSTAAFDELGRVYQTKTFSVDPSTGSVSTNALTTDTWYDLRGQVIKVDMPGGLVQKTSYDGLGRATTLSITDGGGDSGYSDAGTLTGDAVLEQSSFSYDAAGNTLLVTHKQRFHDETGTGALGTATTGVKARVSYSASYYDLADRLTASVDVGTNGGSAYTRPGSVPSRSDTVLVTSYVYDAAGRLYEVTDPKALVQRSEYDALGRVKKTIENYVDGTPSDADDKTTEYTYGPAGMTSLTAKLTGGGGQTTEWVYGVSTGSGSAITSNDVVGQTRWPDPSTGAASSGQAETVTVNAQGQPVTATDRNGNMHTYTYDVRGRLTSDAVTTLGSGVDGAIRRIETAYDGQGNAYLVTSYDAAMSGSIVNQVQRVFNGLGQLVTEYQEHGGAVNTGTSLKVQYAYSEMAGGANHSRLSSVTYPNGKVLTSNYASGLNDDISRLSSLTDTSGTLESYDYLGLGTVVRRSHPQPEVDLTYVKQSGEGNGDAGDPYTGLDRFGRVVDQRWRKSDGSHTDRFAYSYDRNSNRTSRDNLLNANFDEVYSYDGLNQLTGFQRDTHTRDWDYDALGNWDSVTTDGGTPATRSHNQQNEITSASGLSTPGYDASGNMTADETGRQFVYDAWNRLVEVKASGGATLVRYEYDGLFRRVSETASGTTTDLYYSDAWQVLEERVGGDVYAQYVWSPVYVDALVLRDRDSDANGSLEERLWVQQDANFNVTAVLSNAGVVQERYTFDPFGMHEVRDAAWSIKGSGSDYGWLYLHQGGRYNVLSGLYSFRFREYSPTLGRWVTMDPIGYHAGDVNLYRGLNNSIVNMVDPSGLAGVVASVIGTVSGTSGQTSEWNDQYIRYQQHVPAARLGPPVPFYPQPNVPAIPALPGFNSGLRSPFYPSNGLFPNPVMLAPIDPNNPFSPLVPIIPTWPYPATQPPLALPPTLPGQQFPGNLPILSPPFQPVSPLLPPGTITVVPLPNNMGGTLTLTPPRIGSPGAQVGIAGKVTIRPFDPQPLGPVSITISGNLTIVQLPNGSTFIFNGTVTYPVYPTPGPASGRIGIGFELPLGPGRRQQPRWFPGLFK